MAISSIGVGSGLPLDQLLEDLRKSESQPLNLIKQRQVISEARLSGYGIIKGSLTDLQKSAKALGDVEKYGALKATSANKDVIGVKADNSAIAGNYNVEVKSLASQQSLVANGQEFRDKNIGEGGSLTITLANDNSKTIDLGNDTSLQGIMKTINANPDLGVQATMVNDGSGTPYRLMFTTTDTGTEAAVTEIKVENNTELASALNYSADNTNDYHVTGATDAEIHINGIKITSQNNTIEGAIEGVTLDLKSMPAEGTTVKIDVARDDSVAIDAVKSFVKEYNALLDTIKKQTAFDVEAGQSSALTGDSLIRRVENQLRSAMNGAEGAGAINSLADLGVTTDYKTGKLEINDEKLSTAVKDNLGDVTNFLTGENGIAKRIDNTTNEFIKSGGLISNSTSSIDRTIRMLNDQFEATSARIDTKMENYRKQFTQLDVLVNQMNGTSDYLAQQLDMLANMNKPKK